MQTIHTLCILLKEEILLILLDYDDGLNNGVFRVIMGTGQNSENNSGTTAEGEKRSNKSKCDVRKLFGATEKYVSGYLEE